MELSAGSRSFRRHYQFVAISKGRFVDVFMDISVCGPPIAEYEAHKAVQMWLRGGQRRRYYGLLVCDDDSDGE